MSRLTRARERRAVRPRKTPKRVEHRPTGGGVFFHAGQRDENVPGPEQIRDIFRRALTGTSLGQRLGYGS